MNINIESLGRGLLEIVFSKFALYYIKFTKYEEYDDAPVFSLCCLGGFDKIRFEFFVVVACFKVEYSIYRWIIYLAVTVFFGRRTAWMFGKTPPDAIVTPPNNLFNSSSFLTAKVI